MLNVSSQTEERQIDIVRTYAKNKLGFINYTRKWNELQCVVSSVVHVSVDVFWRKITCLGEEEMFWKITTASFFAMLNKQKIKVNVSILYMTERQYVFCLGITFILQIHIKMIIFWIPTSKQIHHNHS